MEIQCTHKKELSRTYVQFTGGDIDRENYQVQMVLHRLLNGLLPTAIYAIDNQIAWRCETTALVSLEEFCQDKPLGREELVWIYSGIFKVLGEMQEYLLDEHFLYLLPEEIYVDQVQNHVMCCMVPFYENRIWENLLALSQYFLGHLQEEDMDAVRIAYGIFRYLSQGGENLEELWKILLGKGQSPSPSLETEKKKKIETISEQLEKEAQEIRARDLDSLFGEELEPDRKRAKRRERKKEKKERKSKHQKNNQEKQTLWLIWFLPGGCAILWTLFLVFQFWYLDLFTKCVSVVAIMALITASVLLKKGLQRNDKSHKSEWDEIEMPTEVEDAYEQQEDDYKEPPAWLDEEIDTSCPHLTEQETGEVLPLDEKPMVIGKLPKAVQLVISKPTISRIHARIFYKDKNYHLEDLSSRNGTYHNGIRLQAKMPITLQDGDEICFANIAYEFHS